jgi:hypothetical protein
VEGSPAWARVLSSAYLPLGPSSGPSLISLQLEPGTCGAGALLPGPGGKRVTLSLERVATDYWVPIAVPLASILATAFLVLGLWLWLFCLQLHNNKLQFEFRCQHVCHVHTAQDVPL